MQSSKGDKLTPLSPGSVQVDARVESSTVVGWRSSVVFDFWFMMIGANATRYIVDYHSPVWDILINTAAIVNECKRATKGSEGFISVSNISRITRSIFAASIPYGKPKIHHRSIATPKKIEKQNPSKIVISRACTSNILDMSMINPSHDP